MDVSFFASFSLIIQSFLREEEMRGIVQREEKRKEKNKRKSIARTHLGRHLLQTLGRQMLLI